MMQSKEKSPRLLEQTKGEESKLYAINITHGPEFYNIEALDDCIFILNCQIEWLEKVTEGSFLGTMATQQRGKICDELLTQAREERDELLARLAELREQADAQALEDEAERLNEYWGAVL